MMTVMRQIMRIVKPELIPLGEDVPLDNLIKVFSVCQQMEIVCKYEGGVGLSAVQVGIPWKLFVLRGQSEKNPLVKPGEVGYFVNCEYSGITKEELVVSSEGCLSIRSDSGQLRFFRVERFKTIQMSGLKLIFNRKKLETKKLDIEIGIDADGVVYQHEMDHARQKLISQIGTEVFIW